MSIMIDPDAKIKLDDIWQQVAQLAEQIEKKVKSGCSAYEIERDIFGGVLETGRQLLQGAFLMVGTGDVGSKIELANGQEIKRLPRLYCKKYRSVFGQISSDRAVYGTRHGQKHEYVPFDAYLQLPESKDSYLLQEWGGQFCASMSYARASQSLKMMIGISPSTNSLQRRMRDLSSSADDFEHVKPSAPVAAKGEIIVSTLDGKGVVTRQGCKKMALVGCSYSIAPHTRTPEGILAKKFEEWLGGKDKSSDKNDQDLQAVSSDPPDLNQSRPKPVGKMVHVSLMRDENDTMQPAVDDMYGWLEREYRQRDPDGKHVHVALCDGQKSLWLDMVRIPVNMTTDSGAIRPPILDQSDHPIASARPPL